METFGVILVGIGLLSLVVALVSNQELKAMARTQQVPVGQLLAQHAAAVQAGAAGRFEQEAEVSGWTTPPPQGPMLAQMSQQPCVWFKSEVLVHYRESSRNGHSSDQTKIVSTTTSGDVLFGLRDQSGIVFARPGAVTPEGAEQVVADFEPHRTDHPMLEGFARAAIAELTRTQQTMIVGYEYREHILRAEVPLFVHGVVTDRTGQLVFGAPGTKALIMANKPKADVQADETSNRQMFGWGGGIALAVGIVLIAINTALHHH